MDDILKWALAALAGLAYFGAAALQTRSDRRGYRVLGRILTLAPFGLSVLFFAAGLVSAFQNQPGSWADLVLAVLMIPFFLLAIPTLYPLASLWLKPRLAWAVPAGLIVVSAALVFFAFRAMGQTGTVGKPLALLAVLGILALEGVLTWFAAFFRNPRCHAKAEETSSPS
jgi:hypothetical protein